MRKSREAVPPTAVANEALATEVDQLGSELLVLRRLLAETQDKLSELLAWREEHERRCLLMGTYRAAAPEHFQGTLFA